MGLEDKFGKVPLRRIFRRFFEALFDPETGHDHDGVNSKPAAAIADGTVTADKIADGAVTADKLADTASLASVIGAGLGAVKTVAHDTEESPITLLDADGAARACLVVALVGKTIADGAEFSIEDEDETALLGVTAGTAGDVLVGAGTLAANKALRIAITAGGAAAAGEVTVFVIAIPEARSDDQGGG